MKKYKNKKGAIESSKNGLISDEQLKAVKKNTLCQDCKEKLKHTL